jgi:hypothetical protein
VFAETRDEMRVLLGPEKGYSPQPTQLDTAPIARTARVFARPRTVSHITEAIVSTARARGTQGHTHMHENDTHLSSMQQYNKKVKPPALIPPQSTTFD